MSLSKLGKKNHNYKEISRVELKNLIKKGLLKNQIASEFHLHPNSGNKKIQEFWGINGLKNARKYL
ncbi:hypothetical protein LCGC14_1347280 [marine sediment metagenome]|uniref:Uncharacterized protein n=1 Tax=marine sediment metagenome TaxID=412755 RepID=A0A0F9KCI3_9ZZZZ